MYAQPVDTSKHETPACVSSASPTYFAHPHDITKRLNKRRLLHSTTNNDPYKHDTSAGLQLGTLSPGFSFSLLGLSNYRSNGNKNRVHSYPLKRFEHTKHTEKDRHRQTESYTDRDRHRHTATQPHAPTYMHFPLRRRGLKNKERLLWRKPRAFFFLTCQGRRSTPTKPLDDYQ